MKNRFWALVLMMSFIWNGCDLVQSNTEEESSLFGDLFMLDIASNEVQRITNNSTIYTIPKWSPDGSRIAALGFNNGVGVISIIPIDGNDAVKGFELEGVAKDQEFEWSPTGKQIAYYTSIDRTNFLNIYDFDVQQLVYSFELESDRAIEGVTWSPDEAFLIANIRGLKLLIDIEAGSQEVLTELVDATDIVWSPNGEKIAFNNFSGFSTLSLSGREVINISEIFIDAIQWNNDSNSLFVTSGNSLIHFDLDGEMLISYSIDVVQNNLFDWAFDGVNLAFFNIPKGANQINYTQVDVLTNKVFTTEYDFRESLGRDVSDNDSRIVFSHGRLPAL